MTKTDVLYNDIVAQKVNHEECVNFNELHICVRCIYFYKGGSFKSPGLENLFVKEKEK
jgi:hypothetical protein